MGERLHSLANYFIIAADIDSYPELPLWEKRELIISDFREEIEAFYQKSEIMPPNEYLSDYKYIVLWRNLPKTNIPNNTEDALFGTMCRNEYDRTWKGIKQGNGFVMPFLINVRNTDTFADGSIEKFIKRYCMVKKYFSTQPLVYDLDMIPDSRKSFGEIQHQVQQAVPPPNLEGLSPEEAMKAQDEAFRKMQEYFNEVERLNSIWIEKTQGEREQADLIISFLSRLYTTVTNDSVDYEECPFIHYYYQWQMGNISVESACQELGNMSKRTFYKYVTEFEAHPYFVEYEKIYWNALWELPKKGPLSVDLEQFHSDIIQIYPDGEFKLDGRKMSYGGTLPDYTREYKLCEKYSIPTIFELQRTFLAVKKKLKR